MRAAAPIPAAGSSLFLGTTARLSLRTYFYNGIQSSGTSGAKIVTSHWICPSLSRVPLRETFCDHLGVGDDRTVFSRGGTAQDRGTRMGRDCEEGRDDKGRGGGGERGWEGCLGEFASNAPSQTVLETRCLPVLRPSVSRARYAP